MADCNAKCTDCTCTGSENGQEKVPDIEECPREDQALSKRQEELETIIKSQRPGSLSEEVSVVSKLRSKDWLYNAQEPIMTAIYVERYTNYGLTQEELMSGKPVIGIAQTGSDLAPCNRHHLELAKRVRDGIKAAGGIPFEFPCHPIQETGRRPTASLDRNLAYLGLVEILHGYPIDGVVLLTGCDKTTPACLMAAATVDLPSICLNVGSMVNGHNGDELVGSGMVTWKAEHLYATGKIDFEQLVAMVSRAAPSVGHCNSMGTALTMNSLAEALGMALPGSTAIPAPYKERGQFAYRTGIQIVEMVLSDRKPSKILTREAFENDIKVNSAIGGSTNAPIHLNSIARHIGIELNNEDWDRIGYPVPLILNLQPSGQFLAEEFYEAGGVPAVMAELLKAGLLHTNALTVNGRSIGENFEGKITKMRNVVRDFTDPLVEKAGFIHLTGNLFESAIMKLSGISQKFREHYLENQSDPNAFEGKAFVFDGADDFRKRVDDLNLSIDENSILVMRGCGPVGHPGAAETVNMRPPGRLIDAGVTTLPCIGDGRQSGTSPSPSILNASPEAAAGGNLAILRDYDRLRVDLTKRRVDILITDEELEQRKLDLKMKGGFAFPQSQTPWQEIFRNETSQLDKGMTLKTAIKYQQVVAKHTVPRHNH